MSGRSVASSAVTTNKAGFEPRQPSVSVQIDGHYNSKIYTSGSPVVGKVTINPWKDSQFDYLQIILVGTSRTRLTAVQIPTQAQHTFLKMNMPIPESTYPVPRIYEAGRTYTIPFNFVIPHHLTVNACNHTALGDHVQDCHMRLPPSMGTWERDDLAPDMTYIDYAIKARVLREAQFGRPIKVMESVQQINVLPSSPEDPPMSLTSRDKSYCLSKSKSIRKNLFSAKQGRLTATACQPSAIQVHSDGHGASGSSVLVNLKFDPTSPEIAPPKLSTISAKIQAQTYFSSAPMTQLPNIGDSRRDYSLQQILNYSTSLPLFSTSVDKVSWKQQSASPGRRDSGYSSDGSQGGHTDSDRSREASRERRGSTKSSRSSKSPSKSSSPVFHTSTLQIPFKLPSSKKMFLPTFHACLISRVYILHLNISAGDSKISLSIPLQIAMEPQAMPIPDSQDMGLPSFDAAVAQQEAQAADEHLRPRLLQIPAPELQGNSVLPGYDTFNLSMRRPMIQAQ